MELFGSCFSIVSSGYGGLSVNWVHMPYPGTILDQPYKLKLMFDIIKSEIYQIHKRDMERR